MSPETRLLVLSAGALLLAPAATLWGDAGVLIPISQSQTPDPSILTLRSMKVDATVEGTHAEVHVDQVFQNLTDSPVEGKYVFPLGPNAVVKSFALWQGDDRFPSVVVEKQRGKDIYQSLAAQGQQPGLLETGDEEQDASLFQLHVANINAWGTARIELTYEEELPLDSFTAHLELPFKPRRYAQQTAGTFQATIQVDEPWPLAKVEAAPTDWFTGQVPQTGQGGKSPAQSFTLHYQAANQALTDDVALDLTYAPPPQPIAANLEAYRNVGSTVDRSALGGGVTYVEDHGYFEVRALFGDSGSTGGGSSGARSGAAATPRDVVILVDGSVSMQWDKLDGTVKALGDFLGNRLSSNDRFDVVVFNDDLHAWKDGLQPASAANTADALTFVRGNYLAGGTDLAAAIERGASLLGASPRAGATPSILLFTDGLPTSGDVDDKAVKARVTTALGGAGNGHPRLFIDGIGDDANVILLRELASLSHGSLALSGESDDTSFASRTLFDQLGGVSYDGLALTMPPAANTDLVYADRDTVFGGSAVTWFGRYLDPVASSTATLAAQASDGRGVSQTFAADLPASDTAHPEIARGWAWQRVQDLLAHIRDEGEKDVWVNEVIALARRYGFVTPYTSMLAASRSLLRPRNLQPGDPLLQVKTDPGIRDVVALFPFGLVKPLAFNTAEGLWETRFLAPQSMADGTYACTLILTDEDGHKLSEQKSFVIDSKPPAVKASLAQNVVRPGDHLAVTAFADADTRTLRAQLDHGPDVDLRWTADAQASTGSVPVPLDLPPGSYQLVLTAEDFARNTTIVTLPVTVVSE
jgi:Ca-activated chloride channel family protein